MLRLFVDNFWPLKHFLNYIFKKTLGDYIMNDLNLEEIEVGIKNNYSITLTNLKLNAYEINRKHLKSSPLKVLHGFIKRFDLVLDKEKLQIRIEGVHVLLMPVFDVEKLNNTIIKRKSQSSNDSVENSMIAGIVNSALANLEVSICNVCVKILSYEVTENDQDNPTFSIFLSKIDYNKQSSQIDQDKSFFFGKRISLDKFCIRLNKNIKDDVDIFFSADDERSAFNFFCDNSCIFVTKYEDENPFCTIKLDENGFEGLKVDININRLEFFINPLQLQLILSFFEVCNKIFKTNNPIDHKLTKRELVTPLKILNTRIVNIDIIVSLEMINFILIENNINKGVPKLWSFYENNYSRSIKTIENLESHYSYIEDNFFILSISDIRVFSTHNMADFSKITDLKLGTVYLKYIEYVEKFAKKTKEVLKFNNLNNSKYSIVNSVLSRDSIYQSAYQSANEYSESSMYRSATEEDLLLINNYNKLLEYDYIKTSYNILHLKPSSLSERFGLSAKLLNIMSSDMVSTYIQVNVGEIKFEVNPLLFFKFSRLWYDNLTIMNEIIFYFTNEKTVKQEGISVNEIVEEVKSDNIKLNEIKLERINFVIDIEEIDVKIHGLKIDNKQYQCSYYEDYYIKHISPLLMKENWQGAKIYQAKDQSIEKHTSTDMISILLNKVRVINITEIKDYLKSSELRIDLNQLLVYYRDGLIISFKNTEEVKAIRKFNTENEGKRSRVSSLDMKTYLIKEFECIFNTNKLVNRNWLISLFTKEEYEIQNFNMDNEIKAYRTESLQTFKVEDLENSSIEPDCSEFTRTILEITIAESICVTVNQRYLHHLIDFFDSFGFALNIFNIFLKDQRMLNSILRSRINDNYQIDFKSDANKTDSCLLTFKQINVEMSRVILCITEETSLGSNMLVKLTVGRLNFSNNQYNGVNEVLINLGDIQVTIGKENYILYTVNTKNFFNLVLKISNHDLDTYSNSKSVEYLTSILNQKELNGLLSETCFTGFVDYLECSKLKQNDIDGRISITFRNIVISPFYKGYNIEYINHVVSKLKNKGEKGNYIQLIDSREVNLDLNAEVDTLLVDFLNTSEQDKSKWTRAILAFDKIYFKRSLLESSFIVEKTQAILLADLSLDITSNLLNGFDINSINKEISQFKSLGFIEVLNIDYISLKYEIGKLTISTTVEIKAIEINCCKDSFKTLRSLVDIIMDRSNELQINFRVEKSNIEIPIKDNNTINFIENYQGKQSFDDERQSKSRKRSSIDTNIIIIDNKKPAVKNSLVITLQSLKIYLFKGKDFSFSENGKSVSFKSYQIEDSKKFDMVEDYFFQFIKNDNCIKNDNTRSRTKMRDYNNYLCLDLQNLKLSLKLYSQCEKIFNIKLCVDKLDVDDFVKKSKYKKLLSKFDYEKETPCFNIKVKMLKSDTEDSEIVSEVRIMPINILVDQYSIFLLMDFFNINLNGEKTKIEKEVKKRSPEVKTYKHISDPLSDTQDNKKKAFMVVNKPLDCEKKKMIYIRKLKIDEFFINFCYNSHELVLSKIKQTNFIELINISNIKDLKVYLKSYEFSGFKTLQEILEIIVSYWKNDIQNQLISPTTLTAISSIRPIVNIFSGFIDIFKQPWEYYKTEKSVKDGLTVGVRNFFLNFTTESLFLGEKVY
jgi:hypothetical protein